MLMALNRTLRSAQRRRFALLVVVLALAAKMAGAHSALAGDHTGIGMAMCLAIADTALLVAGVMLAVWRTGAVSLLRWLAYEPPVHVRSGRPPQPRTRAGPALLQVFRR